MWWWGGGGGVLSCCKSGKEKVDCRPKSISKKLNHTAEDKMGKSADESVSE